MAGATATAAIIGATAAAGSAGAQIANSGSDSPGGQYSSLTNKTFAPASAQESTLQAQAVQQYNQQLGLTDQEQQAAQNTGAFTDAASAQQLGVVNGQGFDLTPDEQARITAQRQAAIQAGNTDIQTNLQNNIGAVQQSAGVRGLRGQAVGQLAGTAVSGADKDYANLVNQANLTAAQQAVTLPQQRLQIQNQAAQAGLTFAEQLRQNAINNRQSAANPAILTNMTNQRLAGGTTQNLVENPEGINDYSQAIAAGVPPSAQLGNDIRARAQQSMQYLQQDPGVKTNLVTNT